VKIKIAIIHLGFALTGIVTTMLGPVLPLLAVQWHLSDAQAGRLFLVQFVASVTGSVIASKVLSRWGATWTVPIGMFLIGIGVFSIAVGTIPFGLIGIGLYGLGLGFALPSTNLLVVEMVSEGQAAALNILNFSWTLGALAAPLAISAMLKPVGLRGFLLLLGAAVLLIAFVETVAFPKGSAVSADVRGGKLPHGKRLTFALLTAFFLVLYIGVENGFSGWLSAFSIRTQHTSQTATAIVQWSFWFAILLGRLAAPLILRLVRNGTLIFAGLAVATLGILLAILSSTMITLEAGVLLSGLGLAAIFPTAVAIFAEWYGTGGTGSIVLGSCGLGGAVVPWLVGVVSDRSQNLRLGLTVTLACTAMAAVLYWRIGDVARQQEARIATR